MAKNIQPNLKLISGYLKLGNSENFVIPEYQYSYSWGIAQCDKLWQDIETENELSKHGIFIEPDLFTNF
jgi:uncharacterized protein with ParB-like and HNH nuclease domain